jgi:secreted PhoX family phosphatase
MRKKYLAVLLATLFPLTAQADPVVRSVKFTPTPAPTSDAQRSRFYTASSAIVTYSNGAKKTYPLSYDVLYRSGDKIGNHYAGMIVDKTGKPVMRSAPDIEGQVAQGPFYSYSPDGNSLLGTRSGSNAAYLMTHFEYNTEAPNIAPSKSPVQLYALLPSVINEAKVIQNKKTGALKVVSLENIDASASDGIWTPCQASQTPWGTHLGGEEYEPNASEFETRPFEAMNQYTGTQGKSPSEGGANPYDYGYKFELSVDAEGHSSFVKHYAMGRLANELGDVMPDGRTVYMGDDGADTVMFMYVADQSKVLSSGTLYAAIWMQRYADNAGEAQLKWMALGHASDTQVRGLIKSGIRFSDIFDVATPNDVAQSPEKYLGYKGVYVYPGTGIASSHLEYLKLKPGKELAAAFLESRRYAAMLGASTEFTKMEGVTHNTRDKRLYMAMSYIYKGMLLESNTTPQITNRLVDDIALDSDKKDLTCGAVYEGMLGGKQRDIDGNQIKSDWVAYEMHGMVLGARNPYWQSKSSLDKCDTEKVANPDNLKYSDAMRTLFIGEDSANHLNNYLWAYNIDDKRATRIFSAPVGSESTGLQVVEDWNGYAYIMSNIQHPAATEDLMDYPSSVTEGLAKKISKKGVIGYIGGLPSLKLSNKR